VMAMGAAGKGQDGGAGEQKGGCGFQADFHFELLGTGGASNWMRRSRTGAVWPIKERAGLRGADKRAYTLRGLERGEGCKN
jgi:hypothetical protein